MTCLNLVALVSVRMCIRTDKAACCRHCVPFHSAGLKGIEIHDQWRLLSFWLLCFSLDLDNYWLSCLSSIRCLIAFICLHSGHARTTSQIFKPEHSSGHTQQGLEHLPSPLIIYSLFSCHLTSQWSEQSKEREGQRERERGSKWRTRWSWSCCPKLEDTLATTIAP